jgi:predicted RNase H-like nuclease (RuvC/YqgF family)
VNRLEAIKLLQSEGWTKADAIRALEVINFKTNPDELTIRRAISSFAGAELIKRQRLQAAQKAMVTKKNKEIEQKDKEYADKIAQYEKNREQESETKNSILEEQIKNLTFQNKQLIIANDELKKDNKNLKNLVDAIKLRLAIDVKKILRSEDSEIRIALVKWFKGIEG